MRIPVSLRALAALCSLLLGCCMPALGLAQIRIGQTTGLTGPVAASTREVGTGARLYIDEVNRQGGVSGQLIELVSLDDGFQVERAVENARRLIDDPSIVSLFLNRGTPHAQAIMPLLTAGRIPLVAPSTGAAVMHTPVHPYIFNVRPTYQQEAERVVRHLGMAGMEHVGVLYVDDSFGEDAVQGAMRAFKAAGKEPALLMAIDRIKPDYRKAVQAILARKPLGVLIVGSPVSLSAGVAALREAGSTVTVATLSNNAARGFVTALGSNAKGVIVSQVFPSEQRLAIPMIAEASRLAHDRGVQPLTPAMLEGFAGAKVLVEGLRRAAQERGGVTRANLRDALESIDHFDLGGMTLSYSPSDHTGLHFTDLSIIDRAGNFRR